MPPTKKGKALPKSGSFDYHEEDQTSPISNGKKKCKSWSPTIISIQRLMQELLTYQQPRQCEQERGMSMNRKWSKMSKMKQAISRETCVI
jgi:hypothetical protein